MGICMLKKQQAFLLDKWSRNQILRNTEPHSRQPQGKCIPNAEHGARNKVGHLSPAFSPLSPLHCLMDIMHACVSHFAQSYLTLCNPLDYSPHSSYIHEILQARILEWVAMPSSRGFSQTRDWTQVSCIAGRFFTIWTTREAIIIIIAITIYRVAQTAVRQMNEWFPFGDSQQWLYLCDFELFTWTIASNKQ